MGSALLLGCAGPLRFAPGSVRPARLTSASVDGFYTLAVDWISLADMGTVRVAEDQDELESLFHAYEIHAPVPRVDFDFYVVIAWGHEDSDEKTELTAFNLAEDGTLTPALGSLSTFIHTVLRAGVHVAAIARRALPPEGFTFVPTMSGVPVRTGSTAVRLRERPRALPPAPPVPVDAYPRGKLTAVRAALRLPARGEVAPRWLDDGTPVWLAHHMDGAVTVLAADHKEDDDRPYGGIKGLRRLVSWSPSLGRFNRFDEYGVPIFGRVDRSLDRYLFERDNQDAELIRVGQRVPGSTRRTVAPRRRAPVSLPEAHLEEPGRFEEGTWLSHQNERKKPISIEEALQKPEGTMVLLDAALVRAGSAPLQICKPQPGLVLGCPSSSPRPLGLRAESNPLYLRVDGGPLFARVAGASFTDVVLATESVSQRLLDLDYSPPEERFRFEISAGLAGAVGLQGGALVGGELDLGGHVRFRGARGVPKTAGARGLDVFIGDRARLDVRGRLVTGKGPEEAIATMVTLGLSPGLEYRVGSARLPALGSLLLPEAGVMIRSDDAARLYLGTSAPFSLLFGMYSGFELNPSVLFVPTSREVWLTLGLKGFVQ